jgi:hypothetical protein
MSQTQRRNGGTALLGAQGARPYPTTIIGGANAWGRASAGRQPSARALALALALPLALALARPSAQASARPSARRQAPARARSRPRRAVRASVSSAHNPADDGRPDGSHIDYECDGDHAHDKHHQQRIVHAGRFRPDECCWATTSFGGCFLATKMPRADLTRGDMRVGAIRPRPSRARQVRRTLGVCP